MTNKTIWITGGAGELGQALAILLKKNTDYKIISTDKEVDITDNQLVEQHVEIYRPNVIINCAGISDEEYCEKNMVEAFKVNALGARNLAGAANRINAKIIHLSTDDVFSGANAGRLTEFDTPNPTSVYGKSKLAGESYIRELCPKHLIIRSSWVYGMKKGDFYSYVIEKAKNNEEFDVPMDEISTPTTASILAEFVLEMIDKAEYGIYHASCEGACSRFEFAKSILEINGYNPNLAKGVFSKKNGKVESTLLENLMMKMTGIYGMPLWFDALKEHVEGNK